MTDFHDVRFPAGLAFGTSGGPFFKTEVTKLANGSEHRNSPYERCFRVFEIGAKINNQSQLNELYNFFMGRKGRLHSFRFKDPFDNLSCPLGEIPAPTDQFIGMGDGIQNVFQLVKHYDSDGTARPITKPVTDSVLMALDGAALSSADFSVDPLTGLAALNTAPGQGVTITAGFQFDIAVRFDTDRLDLTLEDYGAGLSQPINLVEDIYA